MSLELGNYVIKKAVIEVRYDLSGKIYDTMGQLIDILKKDFGKAKIELSTGNVRIFTEDKQKLTKIDLTSTVVLEENIEDIGLFKERAFNHIDLLKNAEIETLARVGLRVWQIWKIKTYEEGLFAFRNSVYKGFDKWHILGGILASLGFSLVFENSDYEKSNFNFGPIEQDQLKKIFKTPQSLFRAGLYTDFDQMKISNITMEGKESYKLFVDKAMENLSNVENFIKNLFSA